MSKGRNRGGSKAKAPVVKEERPKAPSAVSDKRILTDMLDRAGVAWTPEPIRGYADDILVDYASAIRVQVDDHVKPTGYYCFFTVYFFSEAGKLVNVGIWE